MHTDVTRAANPPAAAVTLTCLFRPQCSSHTQVGVRSCSRPSNGRRTVESKSNRSRIVVVTTASSRRGPLVLSAAAPAGSRRTMRSRASASRLCQPDCWINCSVDQLAQLTETPRLRVSAGWANLLQPEPLLADAHPASQFVVRQSALVDGWNGCSPLVWHIKNTGRGLVL